MEFGSFPLRMYQDTPSPGAHLEHKTPKPIERRRERFGESPVYQDPPKPKKKKLLPHKNKSFINLLNLGQIFDELDSEFLTPQRKLLNSIDIVEKMVMEELGKLKSNPTAKKAEREKKVKTLMSMRLLILSRVSLKRVLECENVTKSGFESRRRSSNTILVYDLNDGFKVWEFR